MEFDKLLTQETHSAGAEVEILDPSTGKSLDVFIKVAGVGSKQFRKARSQLTAEALAIKSAGGEVDTESQFIKILARCTIGWSGVTKDGEELPFDIESCEKLYTGSDFVYDQVYVFINDRENFTGG